jgi:hypothetical protein
LRDVSMIHPCVYAVGPFQVRTPQSDSRRWFEVHWIQSMERRKRTC